MKIQLVSDIHTEFPEAIKRVKKVVQKVGDVLILAGDIGNWNYPNYLKFLEYASSNFKQVFYVAGNHEFYGSVVSDAIEKMEKICSKFENLHFLNRKSVMYEGVKYCGVTLWTYVPKKRRKYISRIYNDYNHIRIRDKSTGNIRKLRIEDTIAMHKRDMKWLEKEINETKKNQPNVPVCIISHHCPVFSLSAVLPKERKYGVIYGCCSDLRKTSLITAESPVVLWAYGHTHFSRQFIVEGVHVVSNQAGYCHQSENNLTHFNPHFYFSIDPSAVNTGNGSESSEEEEEEEELGFEEEFVQVKPIIGANKIERLKNIKNDETKDNPFSDIEERKKKKNKITTKSIPKKEINQRPNKVPKTKTENSNGEKKNLKSITKETTLTKSKSLDSLFYLLDSKTDELSQEQLEAEKKTKRIKKKMIKKNRNIVTFYDEIERKERKERLDFIKLSFKKSFLKGIKTLFNVNNQKNAGKGKNQKGKNNFSINLK